MAKDNELSNLKETTQEILHSESSISNWASSIPHLGEIVDKHAAFHIDPGQDIGAGETWGGNGLALSPTMAALCLREIARTATFIKGLAQAIQSLQVKHTHRPVKVLYAGCGPYALLAFPLMSVFSAQQVIFTLIDIHEQSLTSSQYLMKAFGFQNHIADFIQADAASYKIDPDMKPDIILSETMNASLEKEPQVSIFRNLYLQAPEAILIPQSVRVEAWLLNLSKEHVLVSSDHEGPIPKPNRERVFLGNIFALNSGRIKAWQGLNENYLPASQIMLPAKLANRFSPRLLTVIKVFEENTLQDYQTSLTLPQNFPVTTDLVGGEVLNFRYELGNSPGLNCEILDKNGSKILTRRFQREQ